MRRRFWFGAAVLTAWWLYVNWPREHVAPPKSWSRSAGYPFTYAAWEAERRVLFGPAALAANVTVLGVLVAAAWACDPRGRPPRRTGARPLP